MSTYAHWAHSKIPPTTTTTRIVSSNKTHIPISSVQKGEPEKRQHECLMKCVYFRVVCVSKAGRQEHILSRLLSLSRHPHRRSRTVCSWRWKRMLFIVANWRGQSRSIHTKKKPPSFKWKRTSFMYPACREKKTHRNYIYLCKVYVCIWCYITACTYHTHCQRAKRTKTHTHTPHIHTSHRHCHKRYIIKANPRNTKRAITRFAYSLD